MSSNTSETARAAVSIVNIAVIDAPPARVWRCCTDIERWPAIFPSTLEVRRTEVGPNEVVMDMTVENELGRNEVRSHRRYRPAEYRIDFRMINLPPAIEAMDGNWVLEPDGRGTRLIVRHDFVPKPGASADELSATLFQTTETVLGLLRNWIEAGRDLMAYADADGLRDAWGPRTAANGISPETFETCELFFSRLFLGGLDWGDLTIVLKDLRKQSTHADWADWHQRWSALGVHHEQRGAESLGAGLIETARVSYRKAAACHHYAEFFYFDDLPAKHASRDRVTELFEQIMPYLPEAVRPLRSRCGGADVPGYLMTPRGARPVAVRDAGQRARLGQGGRAVRVRPRVHRARHGGRGFRRARPGRAGRPGADDRRLRAGGGRGARRGRGPARGGRFADGHFRGQLRRLPGRAGRRLRARLPGLHQSVRGLRPRQLRLDQLHGALRLVFGMPGDAAMDQLARTSLNLRDVPPLRVPLLAIHGELDSIIPIESCERMLDWAAGETELIRYPGERHVATNYFGDFIPRFCDWMAGQLGAVTR